MVRAWLQRDRARKARLIDKGVKRFDLEDRQSVFDAIVAEFTARAAVHCYLDDKGDVRIVAA
jgi:hypothetical protein